MNLKLLTGVAIGALTFGGVTVTTVAMNQNNSAAPFLDPLEIARSLCGGAPGELAKRRAFFVSAAKAYAESAPESHKTRMALWPAFGDIGYDISTDSADAQAWFNQGLAFTYNFNHSEAVNAFRRAQEIDPDCAMCYWGEAFALGPNINAPMEDDAVAPAYAAFIKAQSLRDGASLKERALINALSYRYEPQPVRDRAKLDNAFADAMDDVVKKYPEDDFIAALAAEANMDTQPWDYWLDGGRLPKGRTARTLSLLEGVLARNPEHQAAIHLYIHTTEASRDPYRAADYADNLADLSPGLGHLMHMPTHTYYRIGRFKDSLAHNIKAVAADAAYLDAADDVSILYEYGYYTHNIHFAMTSAQMAGDGETALAMAKRLDEKLPMDMATVAPWVQPIKAAPYYAMVQFSDPLEIIDLPEPADALPFIKDAWHYARGEAFAKLGELEKAQGEVEAISALIESGDLQSLIDGGVPAIDILNIARLTVIARAAAGEGAFDTAVEAMEGAVALQDALYYTEPPFWYYPAKQTLAAMALQAGETERAQQLFLESLTESPNNAWVLYGLSESYKQQGDKSGAKYAQSLFKNAWLGGKKAPLELSRL